jgi:hypothetical protein
MFEEYPFLSIGNLPEICVSECLLLLLLLYVFSVSRLDVATIATATCCAEYGHALTMCVSPSMTVAMMAATVNGC